MNEGNAGATAISARLQAARQERGLSLDDVALKTRVPIRHLQHIEAGEWDQLPALTYTVGFVRSYANTVGLNGTELGTELRDHLMQGERRSGTPVYEPADPARVPPRSLAIAAGLLALLLAIGYLIWRTNAAQEPDMLELATRPEPPVAAPVAAATPAAQPLGGPTQAGATGPVALVASSDLWLRVSDTGGARLREGVMKAGERWEVPATAQQPQITTGRPDALRVTVGQTEIPPLAATQQTISNISLLPQDLLARIQPGSAGAAPAQANAGGSSAAQPAPAPLVQ
jgi:transcriptional regulator with XRE-family HTH domain